METITCEWCKTEFPRKHKIGMRPRFCRRKCEQDSWIKRNYEHWRTIQNSLQKRYKDKPYRNMAHGLACCICGFDRTVDKCHIQWRRDGGKVEVDNITVLCPNHHRLYDSGRLTKEELAKIKTVRELRSASA